MFGIAVVKNKNRGLAVAVNTNGVFVILVCHTVRYVDDPTGYVFEESVVEVHLPVVGVLVCHRPHRQESHGETHPRQHAKVTYLS